MKMGKTLLIVLCHVHCESNLEWLQIEWISELVYSS